MLAASELILTPKGRIYHLDLLPEQVAETVFLVGDPGRVRHVSKHFDRIEHKAQHREFITHTGWLGGRRLTVLSTGIGTDNIDIVLNELDALVNIDFQSKTVKEKLTSLRLIRLGTAGSLRSDIPVDNLVISTFGVGLDNLLPYYKDFSHTPEEEKVRQAVQDFGKRMRVTLRPSVVAGNAEVIASIGVGMHQGITLTCPGFYAPQGRALRLGSVFGKKFFENVGQTGISNFEMETSGIYGLAKMMGHRAASCSAILANRISGTFSKNPGKAVERLIGVVLERITL